MKNLTNTSMRKDSISFLVVAILFALSSCSSKYDQTTSNQTPPEMIDDNEYNLTQKQFTSSGMKLGKLETIPFHNVVKATGMFNVPPENRAMISTYFGGVVTKIQLLPGERVKKGQPLFTLENPDYVQIQQDYLEAKGQLTYLKSDFERQKNLVQDKVSSEKNFLKAESDYTVKKVKLESLGKKLSLMGIDPKNLSIENIRSTIQITSPINGFVTDVNIAKGAYLAPSQTAITIIDTEHLHLELTVFEKDLPKIKIGQPIQFTLQEDNSSVYDATVHLVNKAINTENRTVGIQGHLINESLSTNFNPGMYLEADILTTSTTKHALPSDAVVEVNGKYFILALKTKSDESYSFEKKEVKLGISNNGYVEILNKSELKDDLEILVTGAFNLIVE